MRAGVLGPLLMLDDAGRPGPLLAPRLRVLLAALLLHANSPVSAESLAELVWDGAPPAGAATTLRTYIRRLRTSLGPAWEYKVLTRPPGYLFQADQQEVDALWFEALCHAVDTAVHGRQWAQASQTAELAASLWRGVPLLDVPCRALHDKFVPRFEQLHIQLLENQAEAELALGRHKQWIQPLRDLVAAYPLREQFHAQLMLALHRSGRQAEALAAYRNARKTLLEELGVEPGPGLRRMQSLVLAGGDEEQATPRTPVGPRPGSTPAPAPSTAATAATGPRQLPAATGHFTGRLEELDLIAGLHGTSHAVQDPRGTVVICAVDGMGGVGKTALAIHAAHRLAERFPDGQLFIDLHGHTQGHSPGEPGEALGSLLRTLGVPTPRIPAQLEERAALYRQHLADTRTLVLLDNALDEAQVRPLLPAAPGCLVLVTSRRRLKGLHDAHVIALDVLPHPDALTLLRTIIAPTRAAADDPELTTIVDLCGRLPLALRIAGALLRHRPAWTPAYLADMLRDEHQRLDALADGDHDLRAVFDLSYAGLAERHKLLIRRLALIPGPESDAFAAAALLDARPAAAMRLLEDLVDHNLLIEHAPGRYRLHDLVRAHARDLADHDPRLERDKALDRLLHYYAHTAQSASIRIARYPRAAPQGPAPTHAPAAALSDPDAAHAWLRAERDNLEAAHAQAQADKMDEHSLALATGLAEIMRHDGPFTQAVILQQAAAATAGRHGRPGALATALAELGHVRGLIGDYGAAEDDLRRAVELHRTAGQRLGEASALMDLGRVRGTTGDFTASLAASARAAAIYQATGHLDGEATALIETGTVRGLTGNLAAAVEDLRRAVEIYRTTGHRLGQAHSLNSLGTIQQLIGDASGALESHSQSLEIFRALGSRQGEARALTKLAESQMRTGNHPAALEALTLALEMHRALGSRGTEASVLTFLGDLRVKLGDHPGALDLTSQALDIYRAIGDRANEAWALNHHAAAVAASGDPAQAFGLYQQALSMNRELHKPDDEAVALEGLGGCHLADGETQTGAACLREALEIYERLGMAGDTGRVRDRLAGLAAA